MYVQTVNIRINRQVTLIPTEYKQKPNETIYDKRIRKGQEPKREDIWRYKKTLSNGNVYIKIKKVLKKAYDTISALYNESEHEHLCRLSLYTVFCLTIDKLYIQNDIEDNFSHFIQWNALKSTR